MSIFSTEGKVSVLEQETLRFWRMSHAANSARQVNAVSDIVSEAEDEIELILCKTSGRALRTAAKRYVEREARLAGKAKSA